MHKIILNHWFHEGRIRLRPGLVSNLYRRQDGWMAQEMFRGPQNQFMGLLITDSAGKFVRMAKGIEDLPVQDGGSN